MTYTPAVAPKEEERWWVKLSKSLGLTLVYVCSANVISAAGIAFGKFTGFPFAYLICLPPWIYVFIGFLYLTVTEKDQGLSWTGKVKLMFWWPPTMIRRRHEKIAARVYARIMGAPGKGTIINTAATRAWMNVKRIYVRKKQA